MSGRRHWSTTVREAIRLRFGKACHMCLRDLDERGFELDHHIPLAIGGEDEEANLRPLCTPCHKLKTKGDVRTIAKAKRVAARHNGSKAASHRPIRSHGFEPAPPQHKATGRLKKWSLLPQLGQDA